MVVPTAGCRPQPVVGQPVVDHNMSDKRLSDTGYVEGDSKMRSEVSRKNQFRSKIQQQLGVFFDVLVFRCIFGFGVSIIPKWLINDSGHIPILFASLLDTAGLIQEQK